MCSVGGKMESVGCSEVFDVCVVWVVRWRVWVARWGRVLVLVVWNLRWVIDVVVMVKVELFNNDAV